VPLELKEGEEIKHHYEVMITKAIGDQESMGVFEKYQASIHNEPDKSFDGYCRFLCRNPLYDPLDVAEANR